MLPVGPPMPDGSKAIGQTKRDTLVLQVGGCGLGHEADNLIPVKNIPLGNLG
jgi:hypothetical protein